MEFKTAYCHKCDKQTPCVTSKENTVGHFGGREYTFEITVVRCGWCGDCVIPQGLVKLNIEEMETQYWRMVNK